MGQVKRNLVVLNAMLAGQIFNLGHLLVWDASKERDITTNYLYELNCLEE